MEKNSLFKLWELISSRDTIIIAIDGNSYPNLDEEIKALSCLNQYDQFKVLYVTSKKESEKELDPITWCPNYRGENEIILKRKNSSDIWGSGFDDPMIMKILSIDLIACISIGNIAVTKEDTKPHIRSIQKSFIGNKTYIGNLSECLSAIRAWINKQSKLTVKNHNYSFMFSNWSNVLTFSDKLTPHFYSVQYAVLSLNQVKLDFYDGNILEYFYSISTRMIHVIITRDILEVLKLNNYDSTKRHLSNYSLNMTYYFGYLLILVTGILDSIGCIVNWAIESKINKYHEINLRKFKKDSYRKLLKTLNAYSKELADYIDSPKNQHFFELIYCLRNFVAHGVMPKRMKLLGNYQGLHGDLILLESTIEDKIMNYANEIDVNIKEIGVDMYKPSKNMIDNKVLLDPVLFTRYIVKEVLNFTDNVSRLLVIQKKISEKSEMDKYNDIKMNVSSRKINKSMQSVEYILNFMEYQFP